MLQLHHHHHRHHDQRLQSRKVYQQLIGAAFNNQLSIIVSSYQHRGYCHGNVIIVINTTISINILEYIFRSWVGRENYQESPRKRAEVYDGWEWVWGRLPRWLRFRSAVDNTLQCTLQCIYNVYVSYKVCSVCLDLRLTSKGGAGCFLSSPAAADDPPTCICIHPGGTHVNTNTSWWHTYIRIHPGDLLTWHHKYTLLKFYMKTYMKKSQIREARKIRCK